MLALQLLIFSNIPFSSSELVPRPEDDQNSALNSLLTQLLPALSSCLVLVFPSSSPYLHLVREEHAIRVHLDSPVLLEALIASYQMGCDGYVTEAGGGRALLDALGEARMRAMARHTPRLVVLSASADPPCQLLRHHEALYIPDLLLLAAQDSTQNEGPKSTVSIYTNQFVGNEDTGSTNCVFLGKWPLDEIDFFPDKTSDLQGKTNRIFAIHYPPATVIQPGVRPDGMEIQFGLEFCRKYNCSVEVTTGDGLWGQIYGNGTGVGLSGTVYMDKADMAMGGFGTWLEEFAYIDYSIPYIYTKITLLVPKPARLPAWSVPVLPFTSTLWALQIFSVLMAAVMMTVVNKMAARYMAGGIGGEFSSFGGTLLRALAMAVLQPPPDRLPSSSPLRKFFTIFEVLFLFFTTIYAGALSAVLTVPLYYKPVDSPQDVYESGLRWAAPHEAWVFSIMEAPEPYLQGVVSLFESHDTEGLMGLARKGGYGFSVEMMPGGHFAQMDHLTGDVILGLHVMKKELYPTALLFLFRKGSPFTEKINYLVTRCLDAGLFLLWETNVTLSHLSGRTQTAFAMSRGTKADDDDPTQLQVVHLQGAFILLGLGLALSTAAFLMERLRPPKRSLCRLQRSL